MIKPDWKHVSELQNMTYEQQNEMIGRWFFVVDRRCSLNDGVRYAFGLCMLIRDVENGGDLVFYGITQSKDPYHSPAIVHHNITHYAPFDVAPPEEE